MQEIPQSKTSSPSTSNPSSQLPDWVPRYTRKDLHVIRRSWHMIGSVIM